MNHLAFIKNTIHRNPLLTWVFCFIVMTYGYAQNNQKQSLNGEWSFKVDPYSEGENSGWTFKDLDTSSWDTMSVPGNWDLKNEYSEYVGDAWYSRIFPIDKSIDNQQVRLVFQSVYNHSKVWINGHLVGDNDFGFLPFQMDITKHLKAGNENRVTVLVNNVFKSGAMWNWGGIRRPVWLETTPKTRLEFQHIDAVPDLKKGTAKLDVKINSSNIGDKDQHVKLNIEIKRKDKVVVHDQIKTIISANTKNHIVNWSYVLPKSKVALWHYDFPNLYESTVTISDEKNKELHCVTDHFGIRKLEIDGLKLLLNGESIRPVGFNVVPEDRFTGNTLPFERIKEDVDLMKSLGANMARLSHVSLPKEYLDYLDEKGIMIFEEVGLWGKDVLVDPDNPKPKEWLHRIVKENYNHPSIVGWSIGNEIGDEDKNPKVHAYVKSAVEMVKRLNANRLAVYASNTAQKSATDAIIYTDLAMINAYGGWGKVADRVWNFHKKPIFMSEFGNQLNSEDPNLGDIPIKKMLDDLRNKEYVLGASLWTFNDYRSTYHGRSGWKTPPSQNRAWGVVTSFRDKKRGFFSVQKEYAPIKSLEVTDIDRTNRNAKTIIKPRGTFDIPANVLRGFQIQYTFYDINFKAIETQTKSVKVIYPGDQTFDMPIEWNSKETLSMLKVAFLDPQDYKVYEHIINFDLPQQPVIEFTNTANNAVRIFFERSKDAKEYFVQYKKGDSIYLSDKTINNFIEIEDEKVKQGDAWTYQLFAVNDKGQSKPSKAIELVKDEDELPPIIWSCKRINTDLFVAFSVSPYDYLFEVVYGTKPNTYDKKLTTKVKGVFNIPKLKKEDTIYFKMRVIKQWGFASEWTQEYKIY